MRNFFSKKKKTTFFLFQQAVVMFYPPILSSSSVLWVWAPGVQPLTYSLQWDINRQGAPNYTKSFSTLLYIDFPLWAISLFWPWLNKDYTHTHTRCSCLWWWMEVFDRKSEQQVILVAPGAVLGGWGWKVVMFLAKFCTEHNFFSAKTGSVLESTVTAVIPDWL